MSARTRRDMRKSTLLGVAALLLLGATATHGGPKPYTRLAESKPVQVNGAEFVALAEEEWVACNPPYGRDPIEVQLRITNRGDKDLVFPTFDTFQIVLKTPDETKIRMDGGRDHTLRGAKPVLIRPGASYCLCRKAELCWNKDGKSRTFVYQDGTGSMFSYGPLQAGKYTLSFWYALDEKKAATHSKLMGNIPVWSGKAVTHEVPFEVVDPK